MIWKKETPMNFNKFQYAQLPVHKNKHESIIIHMNILLIHMIHYNSYIRLDRYILKDVAI